MKNYNVFNRILLFLIFIGIFYHQPVNAEPKTCRFDGIARYEGRYTVSSDQIKAYDNGGQDCTQSLLVDDSGNFSIQVTGDDPDTPGDEGAIEGTPITFKINGKTAQVTSGNNIFNHLGLKNCNIEVFVPPPNANPGGPYSGNEGSSISFNGSGSTGAVSYSWNFGDGGTSTEQNPSHTYADNRPNNAPYTVSLTATNSAGQTDTKTTTATVSNVAPTVSASSSQPQVNEGSALNFTGSHTDPGSTLDAPFTYTWNFGDGTTASGASVSHTFANHGNYTVRLTVNDKDGGSGYKEISVQVNNVSPIPEAGSDQTVNEGALVNFSGSATDPGIPGIPNYGVRDVLTYSWNFGDGGTATGQNVSHTFPYAHSSQDQYTVVLTVNDGTTSGTDQLILKVNNVGPTANPGGPYQSIVNQSVQFHGSATDPGSGDVLTYNWDLDNDGQYDDFTGQDPQKTYTSIGTYPVSLRVTDAGGGTDTKGTTVTVAEGIRITLRTSPLNFQVNFDDQMYDTPRDFYVPQGSTHTIEVPFEQYISADTKYYFDHWSDGGAKRHQIVVSGEREYIAYYIIQYKLTVTDGGKGGHPIGTGWYGQGASPTISIDAQAVDQAGTTRYPFLRWAGSGNGSYSGTSRTVTVTMGGPITESAVWGNEEYLLRIESSYGNPTGGGWYAKGNNAAISIDTVSNSGSGTRSKFVRWAGEGSSSYSGTARQANLTMNSPVVERAQWSTEYYLDLESSYGSPKGENWYAAGTVAQFSVDTVVSVDADLRWRFKQWTGSGANSYTGQNPVFNVTMNNPITETVQWQHQYRVQVVSPKGNPKGGGWYMSGLVATFSVDSVDTIGTMGGRYRFNKWLGTGTNFYTGTDLSHSIVVQGPVIEEADWKKQYFIAIQIDPAGSGNVTPIGSPGNWGTALDTLNLKAMGAPEGGYGFLEWAGDTTGSSNPLKLIVKKSRKLIARFKKGNVLFNTNPAGLFVKVEGVQVISPAVYNWPPGELRQIGTISNQGDNVTTKFTFTSWSDKGDIEHLITVPGSFTTYTANFNAQYYLDILSDYGTPVGEAWYVSGTQATVKIDSVVVQNGGIRQKFNGWKGYYTGFSNPVSIKIDAPVLERAEWKPQYQLNVTTFPPMAPGARVELTPSGAWYDPGKSVQLKYVITDPSYTFIGWTGDANETTNPITTIMNNPKNIVANFKTPNSPPTISGLPDLAVLEDEELNLSFAWLSKYIKDPNDPLTSLRFGFEGALHFTINLDVASQMLIIKPTKHWFGSEKIVINATDPGGMIGTGSVTIKVLSVPDSPNPFTLISPRKDSVISGWNLVNPLRFVWQKAVDPDLGDAVHYTFVLSSQQSLSGANTLFVSSPADTFCSIVPSIMGVCYWGVVAQDNQGNSTKSSDIFKITIQKTDVADDRMKTPQAFELLQNFPNPFNPETSIWYRLPEPVFVRLNVFDMQGRLIRVLVEKKMQSGEHHLIWDGKNENGQVVSSGIYLLYIEAGKCIQQKRMTLVK